MNLIQATFSGLPLNYCPPDWETLISDAFSYTSLDFTVTAGYYYNYSDTQPDASHRVFPWVRKYGYGVWDWDASATPQAAWVQRHQVPASSGVRLPFEGTEAEAWAFDGGDGTDPAVDVPTAYNGAMWEVDHNYDGRSPMGPGTVGSDTLVVATAYGSATVQLTSDQLGHTHVFGNYSAGNDDARFLIGTSGTFTATNSMMVHGDSGNPEEANITAGNLRTAPSEVDATQDPVSVVHPVRGCFMLKRTARVYYKV